MSKDFKSGFNKLKSTSNTVQQEMTTHVPVKKKKMGRPTTKKPNIDYVRVSVDMPLDMRADIKRLLYSEKFQNLFPTQNDFIIHILNEFIDSNK